jgi:transcriptional regulator with AAA-type ATPase domain/polyferredoxin
VQSEGSTDRTGERPLSPEIIGAVASLVVSKTYDAGETILERGEPGRALFIVRSGAVEAVIRDEEGMTIPLARFGPGSYFGEMSVLTGEPTSADVVALERSVVSVLLREDVERVLASVPALGRHFAATLADRLRQANLSIWDVHRRQQAMGQFLRSGGEEAMLVGDSSRARRLRETVAELAEHDEPVLIVGEEGVGKAMLGRCIHQASARADGPLIAVDCAVLEPEQIREALFGSSDPAAVERFAPRLGYVHLADGGTLLLENIGELPASAQADVLAFLGSAQRAPTAAPSVDVRLMATNDEAPDDSSASRAWQPALAERLAGTVLTVPPLRQRKRDIRAFVEHFLAAHAAATRSEPKALTADAMRMLLSSDYSYGNIQELRDSVERAARLADGQVIDAEHIFLGAQVAVEGGQYDLFNLGWLHNALHRGIVTRALRAAVVAVFGLITVLCLVWPQSEPARHANAAVWTIWWPLLLLSFLPVGRYWCAVCPISLVGELFQRIKCLDVPPPSWMKAGGPAAVLVGFLGIVWLEHVAQMHRRPVGTALLLLGLMALAGIVGLVCQRHSWCRYLCPLGGMAGTMSLCSAIRLRANRNICASQCTDHECYKGTETVSGCPMFHHALFVDNSHHCKLCMECLRTCPHGSVRVYAQAPMKGLWAEGRISPLTAAFSVTLAGAALILALSRWAGEPDIALRTAAEFSLATAVVLGLGLFVVTAFTRIAREPRALEAYPWVRLSLAFAPLGWAVLLCYHLGTSVPLHNVLVAVSPAASGPAVQASLLEILHASVILLGAAMTAVTFWRMYVGHFRLAAGTSKVAWAACLVAAIAYGLVAFGSYWRGVLPA